MAGTSAQIVAGGAGTMATCGASLVFSGIGLRRASVNSQKCKLIEARLSEKGWVGHDFEFVVSALTLQFARLAAFWLACVIRVRWLSYSQQGGQVAAMKFHHVRKREVQFLSRNYTGEEVRKTLMCES
ncbi:hypothetical protein BR93DRAFT_941235 [Coniochaeta sp. PMI_546]|nr:hypothetical protein BR93DRAFT_941235 [Coniochaeta sp. PMI_546]